jgi:predicted DNA binding CopG/RHH family protein
MNNKTNLPKFKNENQERDFWAKFDLSKHFEPKDFTSVSLPNLKPSSSSISIRIPNYLLVRLKEKAHELHIPYQTLMKQYIAKEVLNY